jgi:hypothetical protein
LQLQTHTSILVSFDIGINKILPLPEIDLDEDGNVGHLSVFKQIKMHSSTIGFGVITLMLYR